MDFGQSGDGIVQNRQTGLIEIKDHLWSWSYSTKQNVTTTSTAHVAFAPSSCGLSPVAPPSICHFYNTLLHSFSNYYSSRREQHLQLSNSRRHSIHHIRMQHRVPSQSTEGHHPARRTCPERREQVSQSVGIKLHLRRHCPHFLALFLNRSRRRSFVDIVWAGCTTGKRSRIRRADLSP